MLAVNFPVALTLIIAVATLFDIASSLIAMYCFRLKIKIQNVRIVRKSKENIEIAERLKSISMRPAQ